MAHVDDPLCGELNEGDLISDFASDITCDDCVKEKAQAAERMMRSEFAPRTRAKQTRDEPKAKKVRKGKMHLSAEGEGVPLCNRKNVGTENLTPIAEDTACMMRADHESLRHVRQQGQQAR